MRPNETGRNRNGEARWTWLALARACGLTATLQKPQISALACFSTRALWRLRAGGRRPRRARLGLSWQRVPSTLATVLNGIDPDGAARAMQSMLGMKKLDIAAWQAAYNG